ncbi:MAG: TonB-dependent receptor [bacterium]
MQRSLRLFWSMFLVLCMIPALARSSGKIAGTVVAKGSHEPLSNANVILIGTGLGTSSQRDGRFSISNVPAGNYEIRVAFIGYEIENRSISVKDGETLTLSFALEPRPLQLDEVRVEAIRERAEQPISIDVVTEEEIKQSRHVGAYDIFKATPGVHIMQGHAIGFGLANKGAGRVLIRGLGRRAGGDVRIRGIQVLVDGMPDFSQSHGHPFPDVHAVDNIEKIEIIKGPASVRYGNAMAGAIIMTTKTPEPGLTYYVKGSGGSYATTENLGRIGYGAQNGYIQVSGNVRHTDGHRDDADDALTAYNGSLKAGYHLRENLKLSVNTMGGKFKWDNPGPGGLPGGKTNWVMSDLNLNYAFSRHAASLKLWTVHGTAKFKNGLDEPNTSFGIKSKTNIAYTRGGNLTLGFEWMNYNIGRENATSDVSQGHFNEVAPYFLLKQEVSAQVLFEAGLRFTHNEQFGEDVSPEFGILYKPQPQTALRTRVAHGFRTPNAFETTFGGNSNPNLDAADLWQVEAGVNQTFGDRVTIDFTGFVQKGDNMIVVRPDENSPTGSRFTNSGNFSHKGIEAALSIRAARNLAFSATTTNLDPENDTALVPQNVYTFGLTYTPASFTLELNGQWVTELYNNDNQKNKLDNFFVLDFQGSYRASSAFSIFAAVDNLLDESYELIRGFPRPGASIFAGISINGRKPR